MRVCSYNLRVSFGSAADRKPASGLDPWCLMELRPVKEPLFFLVTAEMSPLAVLNGPCVGQRGQMSEEFPVAVLACIRCLSSHILLPVIDLACCLIVPVSCLEFCTIAVIDVQ